jgi:hypothetical protein
LESVATREFDSPHLHQEGIMENKLIDKGSYYEIEDCKSVAVKDDVGNVVGMFYCPYIPKFLVDGDVLVSTAA